MATQDMRIKALEEQLRVLGERVDNLFSELASMLGVSFDGNSDQENEEVKD